MTLVVFKRLNGGELFEVKNPHFIPRVGEHANYITTQGNELQGQVMKVEHTYLPTGDAIVYVRLAKP